MPASGYRNSVGFEIGCLADRGGYALGCFAPRHRPRADAKSLQSIGMEKASVRTTKLDQRRDSTAQRSALIVHRSRQALNRVRSSGRYNRAFDDRNDASGCGPANKAHDFYRHSAADLFCIRSRQSGLSDLSLACLLPRRPVWDDSNLGPGHAGEG